MCHNGEINTYGQHKQRAREELMKSDVFGEHQNFPNILEGKSDSASMDMVINCY
jgi:glutamate synthase (ferredoxin)